ncbi:DMT family transporter [Chitinasiproducens palmae]|nr:SMR family transporter [Chitinasiproducens palmae]
MNGVTFVLILSGVMLNAVAQLLLKAGVNAIGRFGYGADELWGAALKLAVQWPILGGLACYAVSLVLWIVALSRVDVSLAYPMLSLGYVVNAFVAWYWFGEVMTIPRLVGIGIILIGVLVLSRG